MMIDQDGIHLDNMIDRWSLRWDDIAGVRKRRLFWMHSVEVVPHASPSRPWFQLVGTRRYLIPLWALPVTPEELVTETGSTLRAHGMKVIETLLESEVLLMANRTSAADPVKRAAMDDITTLLLGALRAEGRVLIKLNVSEENLRAVLDVVPSMKSPTVSQLSDGGYAIETVVDKATVNTLIPLLKAKGATDILELPISKIVP